MADERYILQITLKSGATVEAEVSEATYEGGSLKRLTWKTPEGARKKLMHIDMNEVVAIVSVPVREKETP